MNPPDPILDYSSPAEERHRERQEDAARQEAEDQRRRAVERYNEATFGKKRYFTANLGWLVVYVAVASLLILLLPDRASRRWATTVMGTLMLAWFLVRQWKS